MKTTIRKVLAGAIGALALTAAAHAQALTELNFGVISTEASVNQKKNWDPFVESMSKAIGVKVKAFYATDYAGVIEAMRFNKVQVAWYGNKSAMEAVDRANGEVFAQVVSKDGSTGYYSHLIVNASSPYQKLEDVLKCDKTLNFGIGDPNSTSGLLVPTSYVFAAKDIEPKNCFKTVRGANHQANAMAIANKQVDVATNNSEDLQRLETTAPESRKQIRVIWTSPIIPLDPLVWRKDLDPALKAKLYTFLMEYGRSGSDTEKAAAREILGNLLWSPFHPSSDRQLIPIRKLEANRALLKVQGDDKLSDAEKAEKVKPIKAELAQIAQMEKEAETAPYQKRVLAFIAAEKAGKTDEMKKLIADFAGGFTKTH
jgi:phosphonate transport system substrate-binding protein